MAAWIIRRARAQNNIHNLRLIQAIVVRHHEGDECAAAEEQGGVWCLRRLYELGLVPRLGGVLDYAIDNHVESFLEPVLAIVLALLQPHNHALFGARYHRPLLERAAVLRGLLAETGETPEEAAATAGMEEVAAPPSEAVSAVLQLLAEEGL
jgi:hypothetical protein